VIGVLHGKVKTFAATVGTQDTVLGSIRYQNFSHVHLALFVYLPCLNNELFSVMLFRNCIGALVTRTIYVEYPVHPMVLFFQAQGKVVDCFSVL
jgi:hypothetical protein